MSSEPDPEALQQRIDELEATVQKMLPGRRAVLAGAAGAAAGAFGMQRASNVGEAADGTAVGQIGTSSEKVNVVAHYVTSDSVDTDTLNSADLANASADTVPTAQGDGTLAMQTVQGAVEAFDVWATSSDQTIPSGSWTNIDWDNHKTDQGLTTRPSSGTLRIQEEGTYLFIYRARLNSVSSSTLFAPRRLQSGGERERGPSPRVSFAGVAQMQGFGADDTDGQTPIDFEIQVQHDEGADLTLDSGQDSQTHIKILKIGPNNAG
jgi:hypothetical protein